MLDALPLSTQKLLMFKDIDLQRINNWKLFIKKNALKVSIKMKVDKKDKWLLILESNILVLTCMENGMILPKNNSSQL